MYLLFACIMIRKFQYYDGFESYNFIERGSGNKLEVKRLKRKGSKLIRKRYSLNDDSNWFREINQQASVSKQSKSLQARCSKTNSVDRKIRKNRENLIQRIQESKSIDKLRLQQSAQENRFKKSIFFNGNRKSLISSPPKVKDNSFKVNKMSFNQSNNPEMSQQIKICEPLPSESEIRSMILYKAKQITSFMQTCATDSQSQIVQNPLTISQIKQISTLHGCSSPWKRTIQPKISQTRSLLRSLLTRPINSTLH